MRRVIRMFASIAALSAAPAGATTDSIVTVLVPIQNWQSQGYCRWETLAADGKTTFGTAVWIVGEVLSRPITTFALNMNYRADGTEVPQLDINPISGDPPIKVSLDPGDHQDWTALTDMRSPSIKIEIGQVADDAAQRDATITRAKLALVFALKNLFVRNRCAKVTATIQGIPEQDSGKVRLYDKTQFPYTVTSPHFLALVKELTSDALCMAGRPLGEPLPYRNPRQRC